MHGRLFLHAREHLEPTSSALAFRGVGRVREELELREDEARHDERAADEAALDDVGDASIDDHRGVEERALGAGDAVATALPDLARERTELLALERARGGADRSEHDRADDRREAAEVVGQEGQREREEQRKDQPGATSDCPADQVARRGSLDPCLDFARGKDGDVRCAEPAEDRARGREKKDDEDLIADRRDATDLEQRSAEEEAEEPAEECCSETDESHSARSFL